MMAAAPPTPQDREARQRASLAPVGASLPSQDSGRGESTTWTEQRCAILRAGWLAGMSAGKIAKEMHITRNAVIGKVRRMNLPLRGRGGRDQRYHTKLTLATARRIRAEYGKLDGPQLAAKYGVGKQTIYNVLLGNTWAAA